MNNLQVARDVFDRSAELHVRSVVLKRDDPPQAYREKLAKVILDDMYQFVGLLDVRGMLLEVNRAALQGAGIRLEDIQGKPFWQARWWQVSTETMQRQKEVCALAAQGEFIRYDVEIFGQAGGDETIIIDYSLIPVKDESGQVVFLLAEGRNITEKTKADAEIARKNRELQQLLDRVKELDEVKSQFFANVSHELRTPLALIMGPVEKILAEGDYLPVAHRQSLSVVRRNAATLLKQVNDLLDISKLDAGKMAARYVETDLAHLLRLIGGHFDALALERGITFMASAPETMVVQVDPDKVERVLLNLLSNAFKFTPAHGRVVMSLRLGESGKTAVLSVQDSGPGVKKEDRELIFERFRQSDGGSNRQFGGTGLGLSIAGEFVALHGGTISVSEAPGTGALFQVELPTHAPAGHTVCLPQAAAAEADELGAIVKGTLEELRPVAPARSAARQGTTTHAGRPTVLVVEDNHELNRFIVETLSTEFDVASACNGEEGLAQIKELRPDLVVTDIMMPKVSGDQMIAAMRSNPEFDRIPVIVLSAKADDELRVRLLERGAQDHVTKPFSGVELMTRVRNLVTMKRTQDQLAAAVARLELQSAAKSSQLAESEDRFRLMVASIKDHAIFMLDPEGVVTSWNAGAQSVTGHAHDQAVGRYFAFLYSETDRQATRPSRHLENARATGQCLAEGVWIRSDGTPYHAEAVLSRMNDEQGRLVGFVSVIRDVTQRKRALEAAKESEAKFRTIANAMPQMVWSTLPNGHCDYFNDRWYQFTGVAHGSTEGEAWSNTFHPDDRARAWAAWRESLRTGKPYEIEYRLCHHSGQYRWTLGRALPVTDDAGSIVRWMGTCTDIHDQKLTQEALQEAHRRKDEFLAMLAHELRNPLAPIMSGAHLLSAGYLAADRVKQISGVISRQAVHMTGLINDLLDVSRVTRGLVELDSSPVDMKDVITEALEQVRPAVDAKSHHLDVHFSSRNATVFGDKKRLVQVLTNVLGNAVKYTPNHGRITLGMSVTHAQVQVTVSDNGVGMSAQLAGQAFELFVQGERTSDRAQGGLGIGLALVRSLVKLHAGTVDLHSAGEHQGSTVTICLPRLHVEAEPEVVVGSCAAGTDIQQELRILAVDDNVDAADMLSMLLESFGYRVFVEHHPLRAIELARRIKPHVCILDIGLPEIDGYELNRRLRELPEMAGVRYAALSGYGQPSDRDRALAAGFDQHLAKPANAEHLRLWIEQVFAQQGNPTAHSGPGFETARGAPDILARLQRSGA